MTMVSLIAAIDEQRGIGLNNKLLCHLPADLKHFKNLTIGKAIIMGHNTYDSIGKPLPGRLNIVLTKKNLEIPGVVVVNNLHAAFEVAHGYPEVFIIGGEQVFKEAFKFAQRIYLTLIHHKFNADRYFLEFNSIDWFCKKIYSHPADENNQYAMTFYQYDLK